MNMTNSKRLLSLILCLVLTWTAALCMGCSDNTKESPEGGSAIVTTEAAATDGSVTTENSDETTKLGEGSTTFAFTVIDGEGCETHFEISTDKTIVGEALLELGLIEGEEGAYGLYVKKVNGITADYDVDKTYWAFYVNGEYAMTGVDTTNIENGVSYSFKVEK